jgi:hydrogenase large subunit
MARIAIDPITRVGGHLRVEVDIAGGEVRDAWSSGTMFRGLELILQGRDPRDAWMFAERVCGTCTGVHALASVRAVERAFGLTVPTNARLIRNVLAATLAVRDHAVQFYLAQVPDWVDAKAALDADPSATSILARTVSDWPGSSADHFKSVRDRLAGVIDSTQPGLFGLGYWGHPAYRLSPEQNLLIMAHALDALDWQRELMRIHTLLGGRDPHPQTYLVGGVSLTPPWGGPPSARGRQHPSTPGRDTPAALSTNGLSLIDGLLGSARTFVDQVLMPDVMQLAKAYPEWFATGAGPGNFLSFGEFPEDGAAEPATYLPRGRILAQNLGSLLSVDQASVSETISHAWYTDDRGDVAPRHPADGQTNPVYSGPALPLVTLEGSDKYSWLKAPRYDGRPMEVGPLARMLVASANGHFDVRTALDATMATLGTGPDTLFSTLGRLVAKAVETQVLAKRAQDWLWELKGWSLSEGPRGAVGHWLSVRDRVIQRYQIVDASTWNGSPRDSAGERGPWEEALVGTRVSDPAQPLEILRTLHSFDPCAACAVHAFGSRAGGPIEVRVRSKGARR